MTHTTTLRHLDPGEAFFTLNDHVSCMNFVVFAERTGHLVPERVRRALDTLQCDNQLLQTGLRWTEADGLCFVSEPDTPIELRCHTTTVADWQGFIEQQLSEIFPIGSAPLMRCLYLEMPPPQRSVLALCFHHAVGDGRSGTELLRRLLSLIATEPQAANQPDAKLLPAMLAVHPEQYRWHQQPEAAKQLRSVLIGDYRRHGPQPAIPWLASEASGRAPKFIRLSLTSDITRQLVVKARAQGSSVHGALCAAQLMAQHRLQAGTEPTAFFLSCPVDMRPHLEPVQPVSPTGLFVSLISGTYSVSADSDIWALAREVITQTRRQIARGEGHLLFHMYGLDGSLLLPGFMEPFKKKSLASLPNTMVSNVGQIAVEAGDPAVESISFVLCPMPYQTLFTAASTYQDQLILNIGFDAARLTEANAHLLAQGIQDILLTSVLTT